MRILITGTAGFIGYHVARRLLRAQHEVVGIDGMTAYYDVSYKQRRHAALLQMPGFSAHELMLEDMDALSRVWEETAPDVVIHLAAQAGVRYSLENPRSYVDSNVTGTFNVLECARRTTPGHLLLASTSSVYGAADKVPFAEADKADAPMTLYAATKKATELMAHSYAHLFDIPTTAFRFFTVYGPFGRPDMALFKFVSALLQDRPIDIYNHGRMERDFTYIDDLVEGIVRLIDAVPMRGEPVRDAEDTLSAVAPFRTVNIGNSDPVPLMRFVDAVETAVGRKGRHNYLAMQPGDVPRTFADTSLLQSLTGFRPSTPVAEGVGRFVGWYREYHCV
ncbi:NAD-dependent epimerase/dehydratase family protein [Methylobacterium sp. J-068]|uniref:NAD-dependent epimerase/dehydratase family protein n=1 Tax=Methylobacterium sp. J-068 TaxID=2836649 RepID=UPI001FBB1560|nr:NAD-dependent epimerase/dehydratase family protein [Methylobacterium sp. J-068]MCJ2034854.1 NAD-dependent epimerase/dehydratase family protein [Methylobacterium sp. J-068]